MKRNNIYLLLILLSTIHGKAQPLQDLLQQIPTQNLALKVQGKKYQATLEKTNQINPRPNPELGLGVFPLPVETRLGGQALRVSAMQQFPWFGSIDSQKELEKAKAAIWQEQIAADQWELAYQLEQAYYQLYELLKSQEIFQQKKIWLEALEQVALAKMESGTASAADVLRVQLQTERLLQEIALLEIQIRPPTISINQILNRPLAQAIEIVDRLSFADLPIDRRSLFDNIAEHHPLLKVFDGQQEIAQQTIAVNELAEKPTFGIGADYIMVDKRSDANPVRNGRDILQLKAVIRLPLYKGKYESKEKEELLKIEALEYQKENALSQFKANIEKAYARHEAASLAIAFYEKQIELTQATIRILETDYSANGNNFEELLRLHRELIDYDLKILKAIVQSHLAKSDIERYF